MGNSLNGYDSEKNWCCCIPERNYDYRKNHAASQTQELRNSTGVMRWINLQREYNKVSGEI